MDNLSVESGRRNSAYDQAQLLQNSSCRFICILNGGLDLLSMLNTFISETVNFKNYRLSLVSCASRGDARHLNNLVWLHSPCHQIMHTNKSIN